MMKNNMDYNIITLYHGTTHDFTKIDVERGNPPTYLYTYEFDPQGADTLKVKHFDTTSRGGSRYNGGRENWILH